MTYHYPPPPPPPPPAPPPNNTGGGYPSYGSYPSQRGGHSGRGRGGHADRGGYHQPPHTPAPAPAPVNYAYNQQPAYGPQAAQPYPASHAPHQQSYPQPPQQQWHPEHSQQQPQPAPPTPLPPQNYHPNYAPQIYQQPPQYNSQPPYQPPPYGQPYTPPAPQPGPPAQQWGGQTSRRNYPDRGGPKGQLMGPPIRLGFDSGNNPPHVPAPVSGPYPQQPYSAVPAPTPPAPYPPAPYQGYQPQPPYIPGPLPPYDSQSGHNPRQNSNRSGGFHNNQRSRPPFNGDRRNRSHNNNNNHNNNNKGAQHNSQTPPAHHQKPDAVSTKKKKRKTNTLGLTPGDETDGDDENEEERLNEMIGAEAPNPNTSAEIAEWIAERRAKFPTKAKIEAAKVAAKTQSGSTAKSDRDAILEKQQQRAEKLRKQLEKVESSIKRKREQQDEGDDMRDDDLSSSPSSDSKSDDEKPEVMSARQEQSYVPPPPKKADQTKHCKYYSTGGTCGKRGKCRFVHDPEVRQAALKAQEMNGGRLTLQQRLTLNDKEQEDLTIVQTLKYLQDRGAMSKWVSKSSGDAASNAQAESTEPGSQAPTSLKKEPGHGLPPIPPVPATKYSGWNLSGFGNTGVQTDES